MIEMQFFGFLALTAVSASMECGMGAAKHISAPDFLPDGFPSTVVDNRQTEKNFENEWIASLRQGHRHSPKSLIMRHAHDGPQGFRVAPPSTLTARGGHTAVALRLMAAGADVNAVDKDGETALMVAATAGHLPVIEALLNANADFSARGADGFTAFEIATRQKHHEITRILKIHRIMKLLEDGVPVASLGSANLELTDSHGRTVLLVAANMGEIRAVEALNFGGANLDYADADG